MMFPENYVYERTLGFYDDGGTGSDMRRFVVWNGGAKQSERYETEYAAHERVKELNGQTST